MSLIQTPYYNSVVRSLTVAFSSLFSNIVIQRRDASHAIVESIKVPIAYASGDKTLQMLQQRAPGREAEATEVKIVLPRLSVELKTFNYDPSRKLPTIGKVYSTDKTQGFHTPVPYNFSFELNGFVKYIDDVWQIIEQFSPFFAPHYTQTLQPWNLNVITSMTSCNLTDTHEGGVEEDRIIQFVATFEVKAYFFPATLAVGNVIKSVTFNFDSPDTLTVQGSVTEAVTPSNALPTGTYTITETITD